MRVKVCQMLKHILESDKWIRSTPNRFSTPKPEEKKGVFATPHLLTSARAHHWARRHRRGDRRGGNGVRRLHAGRQGPDGRGMARIPKKRALRKSGDDQES